MFKFRHVMRTGVAVGALTAALIGGFLVSSVDATDSDSLSLQRAADTVAIEATQACYGRAQDVVYRNYANEEKAKRDGRAAFLGCFTPNANISIGLLGGAPIANENTVDGWVNFVYNFGQTNNYLSTRHLIGNVQVVFTGRDTATVYASGISPHFIGANGTPPAIDWIIGNYRGEVKRIGGQWLTTKYQINAEEFARVGAADYPNGRSDGTGNIGFGDLIPGISK